MNWEEIEFLVKEQTKVLFDLNMEVMQLQSQPEKLTPILAPLDDGSIDDGDKEQMIGKFMEMIQSLPTYQAVLNFNRLNRDAFGKMYAFLGQGNVETYNQFLDVTQKVAAETGINKIIEIYKDGGLAVDNRTT